MTPSQEEQGKTTLTEKDKTILTGRVYPAITACVGNRGKIILAFFVYYSFILNALEVPTSLQWDQINLYVSGLFTFFIVHNSLNYFSNARERIHLEKGDSSWWSALRASNTEILFAVVSLAMVWLGYYFVPLP